MFGALTVSRWIADEMARSIKKFVQTTRGSPTIGIQAEPTPSPAADPPDDLHKALDRIHRYAGTH